MTDLMPPAPERMKTGNVDLTELAGYDGVLTGEPQVDPAYPTVDELVAYCQEHNIPTTAKVAYSGCGSHTIALEWSPA